MKVKVTEHNIRNAAVRCNALDICLKIKIINNDLQRLFTLWLNFICSLENSNWFSFIFIWQFLAIK